MVDPAQGRATSDTSKSASTTSTAPGSRDICLCGNGFQFAGGLAHKCAAAGVMATIHAEGPQRAFEEARLDGAECNMAVGGLVDATPRERAPGHASVALIARAGRPRRRAQRRV